MHYALSGEVKESGVILQVRLAGNDTLINNDIPGKEGVVQFVLSENKLFLLPKKSEFIKCKANNDFIAKHHFNDLKANRSYHWKVKYGNKPKKLRKSGTMGFKTLPGVRSADSVSFVMVTGMHYYRFKQGGKGGAIGKIFPAADPKELKLGFPGFQAIQNQKPDYWIGNGDNVYYDHSPDGPAKSEQAMRNHWHILYRMPRFKKMLENTGAYFLKDDHDYRFDDADTTDYNKGKYNPLPTHETGKNIFLEQIPLCIKDKCETYRTYRLNKYIQIWMVEGRDYRSPNSMEDGPDKSIWGDLQTTWLKNTLLDSDANFKILVSPTPMIGPDDYWKSDNHTNFQGFRNERNEFFNWITDHKLHEKGFYIICGDRHWQYHSIDTTGIEEFSCGALVDANSRLGRVPGDSLSTDPGGSIIQPYIQKKPSGGFLKVKITHKNGNPHLFFEFYDNEGELLYREIKKPGI